MKNLKKLIDTHAGMIAAIGNLEATAETAEREFTQRADSSDLEDERQQMGLVKLRVRAEAARSKANGLRGRLDEAMGSIIAASEGVRARAIQKIKTLGEKERERVRRILDPLANGDNVWLGQVVDTVPTVQRIESKFFMITGGPDVEIRTIEQAQRMLGNLERAELEV